MNIDDIKKISLVEFLNQLGYQPTGRDSGVHRREDADAYSNAL